MQVYNADIEKRIVSVRGLAVLLDADVADIYGVETKRVNEAVRNNPDKFPADYMLQLTKEESAVLRSKISTMEDLRSKISSTKFSSKGERLNQREFSEANLNETAKEKVNK